MYNNNGIALLQAPKNSTSAGTSYWYVSAITPAGVLKDVSGNENAGTMYLWRASSSSTATMIYVRHLMLSGYSATSNVSYSAQPSYGVTGFQIGHRSQPFSMETYSPMETIVPSARVGLSLGTGVVTFTITNNTQSDILINEIDAYVHLSSSYGTDVSFNCIFAGFNLGEITIAPNDSYSFTITNI